VHGRRSRQLRQLFIAAARNGGSSIARVLDAAKLFRAGLVRKGRRGMRQNQIDQAGHQAEEAQKAERPETTREAEGSTPSLRSNGTKGDTTP